MLLLSYGGKFSWTVDLYHFTGSIFTDAHTHTHYVQCNQIYFTGLIFTVRLSSTKTAKIGPLENFPLYGITLNACVFSNPPTPTPLYSHLLSPTPDTVLRLCQYLHDSLLEDFPAETFLQRPAILKVRSLSKWISYPQ